MTPLGELIETQRRVASSDGRPRSYEAIAKKAQAKGHTIGKTGVIHLTKPLENMPQTETLRALAAGLDLPLPVVVDAALETVGLRRSQAPNSRWLYFSAHAEELSRREREALEDQVERLFRVYEDDGGDR